MLRYPIEIKPAGDCLVVTFPDVEEAVSVGLTLSEAVTRAGKVLAATLETYLKNGKMIPMPSKAHASQYTIPLPAALSSRLLAQPNTGR